MALTLSEFADNMDRLSRTVGKNIERAIGEAAGRAGEVAVLTTPVVTGQARAGWNPSIGSAENGPLHLRDKRGQPTIFRIKRLVTRYKAGQSFFITNGVPYIETLNKNRDMLGRATRAATALLEKFKYLEGF